MTLCITVLDLDPDPLDLMFFNPHYSKGDSF
jgi:hypothetical protein